VLDETYTYQVDQISVVLPSDISKLNIESGKDYATLITCTPYGVNSHRLLVRGHRIPNPKVPDATTYDEPGYMTAVAALVDHWIRVRMAGTAVAARAHRESRSRGCRTPLVRQAGVVSLLPSRILPVLRRCDVRECTIAIIAR